MAERVKGTLTSFNTMFRESGIGYRFDISDYNVAGLGVNGDIRVMARRQGWEVYENIVYITYIYTYVYFYICIFTQIHMKHSRFWPFWAYITYIYTYVLYVYIHTYVGLTALFFGQKDTQKSIIWPFWHQKLPFFPKIVKNGQK